MEQASRQPIVQQPDQAPRRARVALRVTPLDRPFPDDTIPVEDDAREAGRIQAVYGAFGPVFEARRTPERDAIDARIRNAVWSALAPLIEPLARARPGLMAVDLGAGEGNDVGRLRQALGSSACLVAVDVRAAALRGLRSAGAPVDLVAAHASRLPFRDRSVDLLLQSTMLSSVLSAGRRKAIYAEVRRVLGPGGLFVSLDMRYANPGNPHIRPVRRSELRRGFSGWPAGARSLILAPPLQRALGRVSPRLVAAAEPIPFLRSHLMFWARRPETS
jgi:ubiquinone/menaquinone biosynthesis C-methylase UbiE